MTGVYLRAGSANGEKDKETGDTAIWVLATNIAWKEILSAHKMYMDMKKRELDVAPDGTKIHEFKITEQIRRDILDIRNALNPSTTHNYGAAPPPEGKAHLTK